MATDRRILRVVGCDPSLRNWGLALGLYDVPARSLSIHSLSTVQPVLPTGKQVRQNSMDCESAAQLYARTISVCKNADIVFIEVPVGSQSARAMASYGICVGVIGALRASMTIPLVNVTPLEVKMASVGDRAATKLQMIKWAMDKHPEAPWPTYKQHNEAVVSEAKAEHMADAIAAIYAGIDCDAARWIIHINAA